AAGVVGGGALLPRPLGRGPGGGDPPRLRDHRPGPVGRETEGVTGRRGPRVAPWLRPRRARRPAGPAPPARIARGWFRAAMNVRRDADPTGFPRTAPLMPQGPGRSRGWRRGRARVRGRWRGLRPAGRTGSRGTGASCRT